MDLVPAQPYTAEDMNCNDRSTRATGETAGEQAGTGTFLTSARFSSGVSNAELQEWSDSHK